MRRLALLVGLLIAVTACGGAPQAQEPAPRPTWAMAIHGGAGTIPRDIDPGVRDAYVAGMTKALHLGADKLAAGATAVDAVQAVIVELEDNPLFNAGRGAVFTSDGRHELDAAIMDGRTRACGAVTGVTTVRHPILLARTLMERFPPVFMAGAGAEAIAAEAGLEQVPNTFFDTPKRRQQLEDFLERRAATKGGGTVGAVAMDSAGNLAAATSTGGLTGKLPGRIGDSPVIGAGTFADNASCAVSGTGTGEQYIRHTVASSIAALVKEGGMPLEAAAHHVIDDVLDPGDGGVIAVGHDGTVAMVFSTTGMYRGAADSSGRFEVKIWE